MRLQTVSEIRFQCLEDIAQFQKDIEKLRIQNMTFQRVNSVIRYKHDVRREKIIELGQLGLNQAEIAEETGYSLSTVKREIWAIREDLK